ncbi:MAG: undecaprenol kinase [Mariniblastus sp.]|jgi:undecaprenol kinase
MTRLIRSVRFGVAGLSHAIKSEPNLRIHFLATIVVVATAVWLKIAALEWALVAGCVGAVMGFELLNTAIERMADRVTGETDPLIKQAKDTAAAAVLVVSIVAAVIGGIIFLPKAWAIWGG